MVVVGLMPCGEQVVSLDLLQRQKEGVGAREGEAHELPFAGCQEEISLPRLLR